MLYFLAAAAISSGVLGYGPGNVSLEGPDAVTQHTNIIMITHNTQ